MIHRFNEKKNSNSDNWKTTVVHEYIQINMIKVFLNKNTEKFQNKDTEITAKF